MEYLINGQRGETSSRLKLMALAPTSFEHLNIYNEARFEREIDHPQWIGWLRTKGRKLPKKNEDRRVEGFCFFGGGPFFFADLTSSQAYI